jgi:hypothetical protein
MAIDIPPDQSLNALRMRFRPSLAKIVRRRYERCYGASQRGSDLRRDIRGRQSKPDSTA